MNLGDVMSLNATDDISLRLIANIPISIENVSGIQSPKLSSIISLGYQRYNESLSSLLLDKNRIEEFKDVEGSSFILTCLYFLQDEYFRNTFKTGIRLMTGYDVHLKEDSENPVLSLNDQCFLNEDNFNTFQKVVRLANKVEINEKEEEFEAGNSKAREMIEKIKRGKKNKPEKKPIVNLHSLISGLSWKSTSGINITNIFDLTIYQLYDGYHRVEKIEHYNNTVTGIYTGNIDAKKINMNDLNWAKII